MRFRLLLLLGALIVCGALAYATPSCNIAGHYCVLGVVYDYTTYGFPVPICDFGTGNPCKGPIDLCYSWDTSCSSPAYSICNLNDDDSYFFMYLPVDLDLITRPRPNWNEGRVQYYPTSRSYPANTKSQYQLVYGTDADFTLTNGYPTGNPCSF